MKAELTVFHIGVYSLQYIEYHMQACSISILTHMSDCGYAVAKK